MKYFLGIDSGGTMLKAALFDTTGRQVALYRENTQVLKDQAGWIERDLNVYWQEACSAITGLLKESGVCADDIKGVSISAQGKGLYLLDKQGKELRNGIISSDSRSIDIVKAWQKAGVPDKSYPITLQTLWTGHPVSILRWVKEFEPENYADIGAILMSHDYLRYRLTGEANAEITNISESNLYNAHTHEYDPALLELFEIPEISNALVPIVYPTDVAGYVTEKAAKDTGLTVGTPIFGGLFDVVSTAICSGIGCDDNILNYVMGTWSVTSGITAEVKAGSDKFVYGHHAIPGEYIVHEASPTSASNYEWFAPYLGEEGKLNHSQNEAEVAALPPVSSELIFLPFLYGSNAGLGMKSSLYGLQAHHSKAQLIQAIWLGILNCHNVHLTKMLKRFPDVTTLRISGGSAQCLTWMQMLADLTGLTLEIPALEETGTLGAAIMAMVGSGEYKDIQTALAAIPTETTVVQPEPSRYDIYQNQYQRYLKLVSALQQFEGIN